MKLIETNNQSIKTYPDNISYTFILKLIFIQNQEGEAPRQRSTRVRTRNTRWRVFSVHPQPLLVPLTSRRHLAKITTSALLIPHSLLRGTFLKVINYIVVTDNVSCVKW